VNAIEQAYDTGDRDALRLAIMQRRAREARIAAARQARYLSRHLAALATVGRRHSTPRMPVMPERCVAVRRVA
jgi:hypothetical protein